MIFFDRIRRQFITGLSILIPAVLTFYIIYFLFKFFSHILLPMVKRMPFLVLWPRAVVAALSFFLVIFFIWFIGLVAANLVGKKILHSFVSFMKHAPVANKIYALLNRIVEALLVRKKAFKEAVLIEYPRKGIKTLAFVTGELNKDGKTLVALFVPTTPNPTSGFFVLMEENEIEHLDISVEEATTLIISGGIVTPQSWQMEEK